MSRWLTLAPLIALVIAQAATATSSCPVLTPGALYPWQTKEIVSGDRWAEVSIDINAKGEPLRCRMGKNNLESDMGFWVCRSMMSYAKFDQVKKDGVLVGNTVKSTFLLIGRNHRQADDAARKRYFAEHPGERSSCYP